jgi:hypothetical protein
VSSYLGKKMLKLPWNISVEQSKKDEKKSCFFGGLCYHITMTEREEELTKLRIKELRKAYAENPNLVTFMEIKIYEKRLKKDEEKSCNSA